MNPNLVAMFECGIHLWCDGPRTSVIDAFSPAWDGAEIIQYVAIAPSNATLP